MVLLGYLLLRHSCTWKKTSIFWSCHNTIDLKKVNEHIQINWGRCCSKTTHDLVNPNNNWEQRCTWKTSSYRHLSLSLWNMAMNLDRCYRTIAFEWMLERCTPSRLIVGPSILKPKDALHRMNMGDEHHWWCRCIPFHNLIRWAERDPLRWAWSLQQRAFYCKLWDACLEDWIVFMKVNDNIYLKGRSQLEEVRGWLAI